MGNDISIIRKLLESFKENGRLDDYAIADGGECIDVAVKWDSSNEFVFYPVDR